MAHVSLEIDGAIATLTLANPPVNALNSAVIADLTTSIAAVAANDAIRVVILTGAGEKAFVAGADMSEMAELGPQGAAKFAAAGHDALSALAALKVPVIAAVHGFCLGGGCELTLACDMVYASEKARFGQPEVKLGLMPGFGGTQRLARRVGAMRATELISTGRMVRADEAKAIGLCLDVFPVDELSARVRAVADEIAAQAPIAVQGAKAVQAFGIEVPLGAANDHERQAFALLFDTADAREGMAAFLAKRPADFKGI